MKNIKFLVKIQKDDNGQEHITKRIAINPNDVEESEQTDEDFRSQPDDIVISSETKQKLYKFWQKLKSVHEGHYIEARGVGLLWADGDYTKRFDFEVFFNDIIGLMIFLNISGWGRKLKPKRERIADLKVYLERLKIFIEQYETLSNWWINYLFDATIELMQEKNALLNSINIPNNIAIDDCMPSKLFDHKTLMKLKICRDIIDYQIKTLSKNLRGGKRKSGTNKTLVIVNNFKEYLQYHDPKLTKATLINLLKILANELSPCDWETAVYRYANDLPPDPKTAKKTCR